MIPFKQQSSHVRAPHSQSLQTSPLEKLLWKILLISALAYFIWGEGVSISLGNFEIKKAEPNKDRTAHKASFLGVLQEKKASVHGIQLPSGQLDNLTCLIDPEYAQRNGISSTEVERRMNRCLEFVQKFKAVSIAEKRRYGVPASILLAQALLASNAGRDPLSVKTNNFFHLPCRDAACEAEHLPDEKNATEPAWVHTYANIWGSFRDQSLFFIAAEPYSGLKGKSCQVWLKALKKASYSEDNLYTEKLGAIIQRLELEALDQR